MPIFRHEREAEKVVLRLKSLGSFGWVIISCVWCFPLTGKIGSFPPKTQKYAHFQMKTTRVYRTVCCNCKMSVAVKCSVSCSHHVICWLLLVTVCLFLVTASFRCIWSMPYTELTLYANFSLLNSFESQILSNMLFCKLFGHRYEHLSAFTLKNPLISVLCKPYCYVSCANLLYTQSAVF